MTVLDAIKEDAESILNIIKQVNLTPMSTMHGEIIYDLVTSYRFYDFLREESEPDIAKKLGLVHSGYKGFDLRIDKYAFHVTCDYGMTGYRMYIRAGL